MSWFSISQKEIIENRLLLKRIEDKVTALLSDTSVT